MNKTIEAIKKARIIPVVVFDDEKSIDVYLPSLIKGKIPIAEICFRTKCAAKCIEIAAKRYPQMLIGAGTVINSEQCLAAIKNGAKFIVSPGFSKNVAKICFEQDILYIPGVATSTEIIQAIESGLTILKFFPCELLGGIKAIKTIASVFPNCLFIPTGGINNENLKYYLETKSVLACGGSWLLKEDGKNILENCKKANDIISSVKN
jgi:2-dehydro-3-deoxyphosphogluconate aldolase/(4S)-4-hydroxy-2-oxoglutarate aldolase